MKLHFEQRGEKGWGGFARGLVDMMTLNQSNGIGRRCYVLYAKLDATPEERATIERYDLGGFIFNIATDLEHRDHRYTDTSSTGSGFDVAVHVNQLFDGYEIKFPPSHDLVLEAQSIIERKAKGLNNAIKNRLQSHSEGTSKSIDLDD